MPRLTWASLLVTGGVILELMVREVARQSILLRVFGWRPEAWGLIGVAAVVAAMTMATARSRAGQGAARWGSPALPLFTLAFAAGLAAQLHFGARLQSDGFYYFAYLRSIAFDGDVDFTNDYRMLGLGDKAHLFVPTATGYAQSAWTIGPAIVWSPFFAAGHVVATRLGAADPNVSNNGISFPYRQAVCVAGLFYGLLGCWFCYRFAAGLFGARLASTAVVLTVTGSFMLWYLVKEPSMTHAPSMAAVAAFTWGWFRTRDPDAGGYARTPRQWAWLGLLAGVMTAIRWQNALFAVLPGLDAISMLVVAGLANDRRRLVRTLGLGALFTLCAVVGFLPQMIAWKSIYGSWLAVSPVGPQIRWWDPHLVDILFSSRNGLFSWSPVLYPAAIGLAMLAAGIVRSCPAPPSAQRAVAVPMLIAVAWMIYFNATVQDWWGSEGFGGRRFDGVIPMLVVGLAAFLGWAVAAVARHPLRAVGFAGALLVAWNLALMSAAQNGIVRLGDPVSFGDTSAAQARALHRWFGNPFTYPASIAFALRNGLPASRYDLLGVNRFLGDPKQPYGRVDIGSGDEWVIQDGWHAPEREGASTTFRWASTPASFLIPLDRPAALALQIRLHAFGYPGAAPQTLTVTVNGRALPSRPVGPGWETLEIDTTEDVWRSGVNRIRLDFAWTSRPVDVGLGGDPRPLSAAVDYIRVAER
jgi:hypothetical protein